MNPGDRFLIVGLGLMGGSYAMGLTKKGFRVSAIDHDPKAIEWALSHGIIESGSLDDSDSLIASADYVVLALYPKDILPWLKRNAYLLKSTAILTDLAGVKGCFLDQAQALLQRNEFIAAHPMAGREKTGVENADDGIFKKANFLIVPTARNTAQGIAFAEELAHTLGFGRITMLDAEKHDNSIGYVSQLTHAIAVALMNANGDPQLPAVTGDSFRDLTRIAEINDKLWSELFLANSKALVEEIDSFTQSLTDIRRCVAEGDKDGLQKLMQSSTARRRDFTKQQIEE